MGALAHGHEPAEEDQGMAMPSGYWIPPIEADASYFSHAPHARLMYAHIALMTIAWVLVMPIVVMLSIAKSKSVLAAHFLFLATSLPGLLFGIIYTARTPDLYPHNAHHSWGWFLSLLASVHALAAIIRAYLPVWTAPEATEDAQPVIHKPVDESHYSPRYRYSRDSGQGTEPASPSSEASAGASPFANQSGEDGLTHNERFRRHFHHASSSDEGRDETSSDADEKAGLLGSSSVERFLSRHVHVRIQGRWQRALNIGVILLERTILILGFTGILTGVATYGGFFQGGMILTGLAHFIKGGIFFWYGLFTLGRAMGCFVSWGWAWNLSPPASVVGRAAARVPSTEFVESLLFFIYGASNVFLEHLGSDDGQWSMGDLEHVSISIMLFGGGLCGMLLESTRLRDLLNQTMRSGASGLGGSLEAWQAPPSSGVSTNPMPAIIMLLLGKLMSSHHQQSATATMLHAQWGGLFAIAALARGLTYVLISLRPPTSYLPSRPASEIVVSFCLVAGGLLFMSSNGDFVLGMDMYGVPAMVVFTVTMGFTALLLAWEILVLALKGWAVRRMHPGGSY